MEARIPPGDVVVGRNKSSDDGHWCGICSKRISDPRVLACLHSFCGTCIDSVLDSGVEHGQSVLHCPTCKTPSLLPHPGAKELTEDVTLTAQKERGCEHCSEECATRDVVIACSQCQEGFCSKHVGSHILSSGHNLFFIISTAQGQNVRFCVCKYHDRIMEYFCVECDETVCGHCAVVGHHSGHKQVVLLTDVASERLNSSFAGVAELETEHLATSAEALHSVEDIISGLKFQASQASEQVRTGSRLAVKSFPMYSQHLLQEVDDIEDSQLKVLDDKIKEVESQITALENTISFSDQLRTRSGGIDEDEVLTALDKRLTGLITSEGPVMEVLPTLELVGVTKDTLAAEGKVIVGSVSECVGSARHSEVQGDKVKATTPGQAVTFVLQMKDENGTPVQHGGDIIVTSWSPHEGSPLTQSSIKSGMVTKLLDKGDGTYSIVCTAHSNGDYAVNVTIHGDRVPVCLLVRCRRLPVAYTSLVEKTRLYPCKAQTLEEVHHQCLHLHLAEEDFGLEHVEVARRLRSLSNILYELGHDREAKGLCGRALAIQEMCFGEDNFEVATTLRYLSHSVHELGDYVETRRLCERALRIQEDHFGKQHEEVAVTLRSLADGMIRLGYYQKAKQLCERSLAIQKEIFGPEHFEVGRTLHSLANTLQSLGCYSKAQDLCRQALIIQELFYGKDHYEVAKTLYTLAFTCYRLDDCNQARAIGQRALHIAETHFGKDHVRVVPMLNLLGLVISSMNLLLKGKVLFERTIQILKKHHGEEHIRVALCSNNLSTVLLQQQDYHSAKFHTEFALRILEDHFGKNDVEVSRSLCNLGDIFTGLGSHQEARAVWERAFRIRQVHFGKEHEHTLAVLNRLTKALKMLGKHDEARKLLRHRQL